MTMENAHLETAGTKYLLPEEEEEEQQQPARGCDRSMLHYYHQLLLLLLSCLPAWTKNIIIFLGITKFEYPYYDCHII